MQVKKFEAKNMQDALQLVKQELGPEAIILSARDNKKSFGLGGSRSVEVTAAVSEKSTAKRKLAESRLPESSRDKFRNTSAKKQKEFIESTLKKTMRRAGVSFDDESSEETSRARVSQTVSSGSTARRGLTSMRYIDIPDEAPVSQLGGRRVDDLLEEMKRPVTPRAEESIVGLFNSPRASQAVAEAAAAAAQFEASAGSYIGQPSDEVLALRREVQTLRSLVGQFQNGMQHGRPITQHPGAEYGLPFELSSNFERLEHAGVDPKFIVEILSKADKDLGPLEKRKKSLVDAWVARYMLTHTHVVGNWERHENPARIHHFVGPSGHGKTSVLVKVAAQLVLNERKPVAILTADTIKVGAADQLRIFSQILNVPFEILRRPEDVGACVQKYGHTHIMLVDYPGFSLKGMPEYDQLRALMPPLPIPKQTHLVIACTSKDVDAYESCSRYNSARFDDIVVTKIDESFTHGLVYNLQRRTEKPLYAFGIGNRIPEDIELATRERVIDLIFKITKTGITRGNHS